MESFSTFPAGMKKFKKRRTLTIKHRVRNSIKKGKGGKWIRAIKMLNRSKGKFCIPKKGSREYAKAKALMKKMR